jgi:hypothetical protein
MASNSPRRRDTADSPPGADLTKPATAPEQDSEGGDPVCYAFLVCEECGAVVSEGHQAGCSRAEHAVSPLRTFPD